MSKINGYIVTLGVIIYLAVTTAFAADVVIPHSFQSGSAALAGEVNGNFNAVATSVNSKQDRVVGSCPEGQSIRVINETGDVICQVDNDSGDITGVVAGDHLSGGGASGEIRLDVTDMPGANYNNSVECTSITIPIVGRIWSCYRGLASSASTVKTVTVTAPASGLIVVSYSGTYVINHTAGTTNGLILELNTTPAPDVKTTSPNTTEMPHNPSYRQALIGSTTPTGEYRGVIHTQEVFTVAAAGTITIYLDAAAISTDVSIGIGNLIAYYVPNRL